MSNTTNNQRKVSTFAELKSEIRRLEGIIELALLTLLFLEAWVSFYRGIGEAYFYNEGLYLLGLTYAVLLCVLLYLGEGFKYGHRKLSEIIISQWISLFAGNFIFYLVVCLIGHRLVSIAPMALLLVADFTLSLVLVIIYTYIYHRMYVPKDMLLIYGNEKALDLKFKMDERDEKYHVGKIISYQVGSEAIKAEIATHDAVIINDVPAETRNDILKYCYANEVRTYVVPKISDIISRGGEEITLFDTPLYLVRGRGLNIAQRVSKRTLDLILVIIALIPASVIMLLVALAIKAEDGGPVFYRQERITRGGRAFNILKFRSMIVGAEKEGQVQLATGGDSRITKVGNFIRPIRVDELPQLLNILKGDMSIVGPRPERQAYIDEYSVEIPEFLLRTKVKGGLTGYAQIYGRYNTTPYDKLRLDLMYIENYSLLLDIKLIFMTIQIMLHKESTEGMEKVEERAQMRKELLEEMGEGEEA